MDLKNYIIRERVCKLWAKRFSYEEFVCDILWGRAVKDKDIAPKGKLQAKIKYTNVCHAICGSLQTWSKTDVSQILKDSLSPDHELIRWHNTITHRFQIFLLMSESFTTNDL